MEEPKLNELLNIVSLLTNALEFYAEKKNYLQTEVIGASINTKVELDEGYQARFALKQAKFINNYNENVINELKKSLKEVDGNIDEDTIDKINEITKIIKKYNNRYNG